MPDVLDSLPASVQFSLRLRVPLYARLRRYSDASGEPMNTLTALALEEYLDRMEAK